MDGTEVCRNLREAGNWVPILFCTARDEEIDRVRGLELGGDDYITKPFSPRELVARVRSAVRRASGPTERYSVGSVSLDRVAHRVTLEGQEVSLTTTEFDLLAYLMARPDRVITREELLDKVWGYPADVGTRTADVHVAQLRHKLRPHNPIRTVRGVGYCVESSTE
jgi:DNA-binding response OmpR family regulator